MKNTWVNQLEPGQKVDDSFVIRKLELKEYSGRKFLSLELGDKTGRIGAVCWDGVDELMQNLHVGNIAKVAGAVGIYREMPQITISSMKAVSEGAYDPADFLPTGPRDPEEMLAETDRIIGKLNDAHYKGLLQEVFNDGIIRRKFSHIPAAKLWHHSHIGGLAEHTLNVVNLCLAISKIYSQLNRDLLLAGAFLHDIGKIDSYSLDNFFEFTDDGRLLGHIAIADILICKKIARLKDFPTGKKRLIRHLILSHQGTLDQGSPVLPQTLESNVLYIADLLDSRIGGIMKVVNKERLPGRRWTEYVNLLSRFIYLGEKSGEEHR